jgi:predicted nucleic acid-binding protein
VIHLDTSFLIRAFIPATVEDRRLRGWLGARESLGISSITWAEFLCGPVTTLVVEEAAEALGEPEPFDGTHATLAAELFNLAGRRRGVLADCMIAAVAIRSNARLATCNPTDFRPFTTRGLTLTA